ncbi:MAG: hydroxyisourate hydrolase [Myxococcales bacterium]|nr:hydroxyisourate hydrolase [Myxococcales bacterium]
MSAITTHILDTARGRPASGVALRLERLTAPQNVVVLGGGVTDADGRCRTLLAADHLLVAGTYRLRFETGPYFERLGVAAFYPFVEVVFEVRAEQVEEHFHVPILLNPFGYSTYRGS